MRKYVLFFIGFAISCCIAKAEGIIDPGFISMKVPYEFNLPQLGVGLDLPKDAGFIVPKYSGNNVFLEIDDKTNYYFDLEEVKEVGMSTFFFSMMNEPSENLTLNIIYSPDLDIDTFQENYPELADSEEIPSVNSSLQHINSFHLKSGNEEFDMHTYKHDDYLYVFYIFSSPENKAGYEKIIKSLRPKNLIKEREKYETRVKYGYFDKERKKVRDYNPENPFEKIAGRTQEATRWEIPMYGISFQIPEGWWYDVNGRNLIEEDGKTILEMDELDLVNSSLHFSLFRYKDISFMLRYSSKKNSRLVEMEDVGRVGARLFDYTKDLKVNISGIPANAFFAGSPEMGELNIWFETQEGNYCLTFSNMSLENLPDYEVLLNSVEIPNHPSKKPTQISLTDLLQLKEKEDIALNEISFPRETDIENFHCHFSTIGAAVWLPGKPSDYHYGVNSTLGKEEIKFHNNTYDVDAAPDAENFFVHFGSDYTSPEYVINVSIYLTYERNMSIEEIAKDYVRTIRNYNSDYKVNIQKAGVLTTDNGTELAVIVEKEGTKANVIMRNNDYQMFFMITAANSDILNKICSLLYMFNI